MNKMHHTSAPRYNAGLTMVEILITIIVLAIGLLGLASLQMNSLRNNTTAYERSVATLLAYELIDRMRANFGNASLYAIALDAAPSGTDCTSTTADCNGAQIAAYDLDAWKCSLGKWDEEDACDVTLGIAGALPGGDGSVVVNGNIVTVTIQWEEKRSEAVADDKLTSLSITTELGG
jgi:type IV pilus assembly protein PilV